MKRFTKQIDGKTVIKTIKEIVIRRDGRVTYNPTEEMVLADGWVEYVPPTPPEPSAEELLEGARVARLDDLRRHDESSEVNDCIIVYQGEETHYWANKDERNDLKNAVRDCIAMGRDVYRLDLRDKGLSISLPCEALLQMLSALEIYAIDCYNRTTDHEFAIKALTTQEEIIEYDHTAGYPEKLTFEL